MRVEATSESPRTPSSDPLPSCRVSSTKSCRTCSTRRSGACPECSGGRRLPRSTSASYTCVAPRRSAGSSGSSCGSPVQACPPSSPHLSSTTDQRCASVAPPPPLLPEDLLDIVYRYRHELAFAPTLRRIEQLYAEHKAEIDELVKNMWEEWVFLDNIRALQPRIYAPGGVHHQEYLSKWYPLRLKRRPPRTCRRADGKQDWISTRTGTMTRNGRSPGRIP